MEKYSIAFLCHFSNAIIRERLNLKNLSLRRFFLSKKGITSVYDDFAIWVSDYISEFEKHPEIEFHIVSPHFGLKKKNQSFALNGIHYHFFKYRCGFLYSCLNKLFHIEEKQRFRQNRKKIRLIVNQIEPDLIVLCGAENPYYSIGVLDIKNKPIYVILQTLLNDQKRINMGVGSSFRRKIEIEIFRHALYFCVSNEKAVAKIKEVNHKAVILPAGFPTHRTYIVLPKKKEYDFVFFARGVTKYKGIEDLLQAFSIVKKSHSKINLCIIGICAKEYKKHLNSVMEQLAIKDNVHFAGYYENLTDVFVNVAKAKVVVVPGITAGLNSTVRESMIMGMPTICYETPATQQINREETCLLTAPMNDVKALAYQMQISLEHPSQIEQIAANGKVYADREFSNEAIVNRMIKNIVKILKYENCDK